MTETEKIWFRGDFCHFHLFTPKQNFCCAIVTNAPHGMSNLHVSLLCKSSCLPSGWNGGCFGKFRPSTGLIPRSGSTLHFPLLPGCSRHSGCCWAVANSQSERRRVPLTAVMLMKSSPLPHQTFHYIFPVINGYDVTSQVERPSAHGRVPGYFCQRSTYAHTRWLEEFLFIEGKHETFHEVKAKMS